MFSRLTCALTYDAVFSKQLEVIAPIPTEHKKVHIDVPKVLDEILRLLKGYHQGVVALHDDVYARLLAEIGRPTSSWLVPRSAKALGMRFPVTEFTSTYELVRAANAMGYAGLLGLLNSRKSIDEYKRELLAAGYMRPQSDLLALHIVSLQQQPDPNPPPKTQGD